VTNVSHRHRLADLIEEVAAERTLPSNALDEAESWDPAVWSDADAREAHHALIHYREDEDIRSRDDAYRRDQQQWLLGFVKRLRDMPTAR
jgi:hypothetical protein